MAGPEQFVGKWRQFETDKLEEFLKEIGSNFMLRKLAKTVNPEMAIEISDSIITITTSAPMVTQVTKFKVDGESQFEYDGVLMDYTARMEGGKMITTQEPVQKGKRKMITVHREILGDGTFLQTMMAGDVVCKRSFKKI